MITYSVVLEREGQQIQQPIWAHSDSRAKRQAKQIAKNRRASLIRVVCVSENNREVS